MTNRRRTVSAPRRKKMSFTDEFAFNKRRVAELENLLEQSMSDLAEERRMRQYFEDLCETEEKNLAEERRMRQYFEEHYNGDLREETKQKLVENGFEGDLEKAVVNYVGNWARRIQRVEQELGIDLYGRPDLNSDLAKTKERLNDVLESPELPVALSHARRGEGLIQIYLPTQPKVLTTSQPLFERLIQIYSQQTSEALKEALDSESLIQDLRIQFSQKVSMDKSPMDEFVLAYSIRFPSNEFDYARAVDIIKAHIKQGFSNTSFLAFGMGIIISELETEQAYQKTASTQEQFPFPAGSFENFEDRRLVYIKLLSQGSKDNPITRRMVHAGLNQAFGHEFDIKVVDGDLQKLVKSCEIGHVRWRGYFNNQLWRETEPQNLNVSEQSPDALVERAAKIVYGARPADTLTDSTVESAAKIVYGERDFVWVGSESDVELAAKLVDDPRRIRVRRESSAERTARIVEEARESIRERSRELEQTGKNRKTISMKSIRNENIERTAKLLEDGRAQPILEESLSFLTEMGLSPSKLSAYMEENYRMVQVILSMPVDEMRSKVEYLQGKGLDIMGMLSRSPETLMYSLESRLRPNLEYLTEEVGIEAESFLNVISYCSVLSQPNRKIREKVEYLTDELGIDPAAHAFPFLFAHRSDEELKSKVAYITEELGYDTARASIREYPDAFNCTVSLDEMRARGAVLESKGMKPVLHHFSVSEKLFCHLVNVPFEEYQNFKTTYEIDGH